MKIYQSSERIELANFIRIQRVQMKKAAGIELTNRLMRELVALMDRTSGHETGAWVKCSRCGHGVKHFNAVELERVSFCFSCAREFVAE